MNQAAAKWAGAGDIVVVHLDGIDRSHVRSATRALSGSGRYRPDEACVFYGRRAAATWPSSSAWMNCACVYCGGGGDPPAFLMHSLGQVLSEPASPAAVTTLVRAQLLVFDIDVPLLPGTHVRVHKPCV